MTFLAVGASLIPDSDVLWSLSEPATAALNRHLFTHSLIGLALISVGIGTLAWLLSRRLSLLAYIVIAVAGLAAHVGLDLINAYGVELLYPWSSRRFELPLAFILDPVLTAILLAGTMAFLMLRDSNSAAFAGRAALLLTGCYLIAGLALRTTALHIVEARASSVGSDYWTYLVPEPGSPLQWKGIYRSGKNYGQVLVSPLTGRVVELDSVRSTPDDPLVVAARSTPTGRKIDEFLAVPVWRADDQTVVGYDLRFRFTRLGNDWDPFEFCFRRQGNNFILVHQGLGSYILNWWRALIKFGVSQSVQIALPVCSAERVGAPERSELMP